MHTGRPVHRTLVVAQNIEDGSLGRVSRNDEEWMI